MAPRAVEQPEASKGETGWPLDDLEVHILYVRRDELAAGAWDHPRMTNSHWRLYHNDASGAWLNVGGVDFEFERGVAYIIPPGLTMASRNDFPFTQVFVHFDVVSALPVIVRELFPAPTPAPTAPDFARTLVDLGERVAASGFPDLAVECLAKSMVYQAFAGCLNDLSSDRLQNCWMRIAALRPVIPALQFLHDNIAAQTTNAELSALCHMSEDHFIRRFRETVGVSPGQYVLRRRIALATQRLLFTGDSIDEIAQKSGFSDRFYFSRVFSRETGFPPAKYRNGPRT